MTKKDIILCMKGNILEKEGKQNTPVIAKLKTYSNRKARSDDIEPSQ